MALQSSGTIDLSDVNVELGNSATANISLGSAAVRGYLVQLVVLLVYLMVMVLVQE